MFNAKNGKMGRSETKNNLPLASEPLQICTKTTPLKTEQAFAR